MLYLLFVSAIFFDFLNAVYLFDYDDITTKRVIEEMEFEPTISLTKNKEKGLSVKNINCDNFSKYAVNCTIEAALLYNSSRKTPPLPAKIMDWCRAIRRLTNCAIDWNADCRDVTESHFNEESIRGHMHVVDNVCDDEWFLSQYDDLPLCIEATEDLWESCYTNFKILVEEQKNTTHEWTHFETHFYLCCARAQFRRCTLDSIFDIPTKCTHEQAVTLQKFSVIVSEGDVFQDCDHNMLYTNCPGGDPRPTREKLAKLMNTELTNTAMSNGVSPNHIFFV
ncbi:uncharacterized protein LOC131850120, partial [Achroia grisella]|uniref:uncharacterized protein LOC131850120 n=1 Tax=Achroia grisella TaxID=688607 RepID=UPI0027D3130D